MRQLDWGQRALAFACCVDGAAVGLMVAVVLFDMWRHR